MMRKQKRKHEEKKETNDIRRIKQNEKKYGRI